MHIYVIIFVGGGLGACLRYLSGIIFFNYLNIPFPYGTFIINISGSLLLGLITMASLMKTNMDPRLMIFLTIGFCGGFTTFSTFSYEAFDLINRGFIYSSLLYICLSVILSIISTFLGIHIAKNLYDMI